MRLSSRVSRLACVASTVCDFYVVPKRLLKRESAPPRHHPFARPQAYTSPATARPAPLSRWIAERVSALRAILRYNTHGGCALLWRASRAARFRPARGPMLILPQFAAFLEILYA